MLILTLTFVTLYGSVILGLVRPLADITMITRLEPITFVIIGYFFGRLPARQNERMLRDEILRQRRKAETALHAREQMEKDRGAIEEKIKNALIALTSFTPEKTNASHSITSLEKSTKGPLDQDPRWYMTTAAEILIS